VCQASVGPAAPGSSPAVRRCTVHPARCMRAAQLQPPAAQQARTHSAHPQLPPQLPLQPEPPAGASTPLKQQQLATPVGIPATPAARASAARLPSWAGGTFGHAASMPAATVNLELSEETLFREDLSGQVSISAVLI
jgi:hypothetical protein